MSVEDLGLKVSCCVIFFVETSSLPGVIAIKKTTIEFVYFLVT